MSHAIGWKVGEGWGCGLIIGRGGVSDVLCFFFQAEDGIRDYKVTGVQTCALPIWLPRPPQTSHRLANWKSSPFLLARDVEVPDSDSAYGIPARAIHPLMSGWSLS